MFLHKLGNTIIRHQFLHMFGLLQGLNYITACNLKMSLGHGSLEEHVVMKGYRG